MNYVQQRPPLVFLSPAMLSGIRDTNRLQDQHDDQDDQDDQDDYRPASRTR